MAENQQFANWVGGSFTPPPTPSGMRVHTGRFTESPGRGRVIEFTHSLFFDRYETLLLEPLVGHAGPGNQATFAKK